FPDLVDTEATRSALRSLLTPENLAAELRFFEKPEHRAIERPYGRGWYLTLQHELETWDDPDGRAWAATLRPLAQHFVENLLGWLPKLTYPVRTGVHPNTAFSLSRSLDYARLCDIRLLEKIELQARRWFKSDIDYPASFEPSGTDFLSAGLCEA